MKKKGLLGIFERISSGQFPLFKSLRTDDREIALDSGLQTISNAEPTAPIRLKDNPPGIAVGLDVGSSKIVALVGRLANNNQVEILGIGEAPSEGLTRGSISNLNKTTSAIEEAIQAAIGTTNLEINQVITNYSGICNNLDQRGVIIREDMIKDIRAEDIIRLKKEMEGNPYPAGEQIVYLEPQHFIIDDEPDIREPIGMSGQRFESDFHVITGEVTSLNNLQKCVRQAGSGIKTIYPTAIASAEAVVCEEEKEEGIAVIDIGAAVTSIAVYKHGIMRFADTLLLGGNSINADIKQYTGLSSRQAELMKKTYGSVLPEDIDPNEIIQYKILNGTKDRFISRIDLAMIIQSRMEELIGLAYDKIEEALKGRCLTCGIVFTGGDSSMNNLLKLGEQITGLKCHSGTPTLHLEADLSGDTLTERLKKPIYATSVGLLKMGLTKLV